ncbi:hypothetical protein VTL71DRAFT_6774 [Oculimacula yallundae]|uniref:Tautomerase cis-CaaD-like domain-containing protein n=1 Tax=Oculimacula yallundae TaxID=86028 RepID=A0ABR4BXZ7_9HELO
MPILKFYTNPGQLTAREKQELATTMTGLYARIMPAFFVNIMFHETSAKMKKLHIANGKPQQLPPESFFVGGKPTNGTFVRFTAEHIAVNWNDDLKRANQYLEFVGNLFTEKFEPRGWTWEFSVTESRKELWRIQSLIPPEVGSEAMKTWIDSGKALPWAAVIVKFIRRAKQMTQPAKHHWNLYDVPDAGSTPRCSRWWCMPRFSVLGKSTDAFLVREAPKDQTRMRDIVSVLSKAAAIVIILQIHLARENDRRNKMAPVNVSIDSDVDGEDLDKTDRGTCPSDIECERHDWTNISFSQVLTALLLGNIERHNATQQ